MDTRQLWRSEDLDYIFHPVKLLKQNSRQTIRNSTYDSTNEILKEHSVLDKFWLQKCKGSGVLYLEEYCIRQEKQEAEDEKEEEKEEKKENKINKIKHTQY